MQVGKCHRRFAETHGSAALCCRGVPKAQVFVLVRKPATTYVTCTATYSRSELGLLRSHLPRGGRDRSCPSLRLVPLNPLPRGSVKAVFACTCSEQFYCSRLSCDYRRARRRTCKASGSGAEGMAPLATPRPALDLPRVSVSAVSWDSDASRALPWPGRA